ncbi:hypothetical protein [Nocardia sp. NBC_00416]|uniref:hypothetical protein n=1 Tax=Nocardia sp. NBC_00416 TaxID=2975991 RepID=UPI002E2193B1
MGFWGGVGDFFGEYGDDILVGAVSVAGFAVGGPIGAAVAGAVAGGIAAGVQGENIAMGIGFGALGGIGGGVGGWGVRGMVRAGGSIAEARIATTAARAAGGKAAKEAEKLALNKAKMGWLPRQIGGAHLKPGRAYFGLLSSAAGPAMGSGLQDSFRRNVIGYPSIPVIDISEEISDWPEDMQHVYMPDPNQMPHGLEFTTPMQQNYKTLPPLYQGLRESFGKESAEDVLPEELDVSDISGEEAAGIPSYTERVAALREQYSRIRSLSGLVVNAVEKSGDLCDAGLAEFDGSIDALKEFAEADPRDLERIKEQLDTYKEKPSEVTGVPALAFDPAVLGGGGNEDAYAMVLVESAMAVAEGIITAYGQAFQELAAQTDEQGAQAPTGEEKEKEKGTGDKTTEPGSDDEDPTFGSGTPRTPTADDSQPGSGLETQAPPALDLTGKDSSTADTGSGSGLDSTGGGGGVDTGGSTPAGLDPGTVNTPALTTPAIGGSGMGSGLESMMLPQLMQAMMMNGRNTGRGEDKRRNRREREEDRQDSGTVAAVAPGTATTGAPPPAQSAGQAPAPAKAVAPPVKPTAPPPPATAAAAKTPEGNMVYTFPDGRTQEVSAVVARVLDAAFGNAANTDARKAYEGTPAAWTEAKRIGARVDPYQLMTGDIGVWEARNAVLVVFDEAADGQLEAVVDGALQAVTSLAEMRDGAGEFGGFTGFFHPPGIEKAATAPSAAPAELSTEQSATVPA